MHKHYHNFVNVNSIDQEDQNGNIFSCWTLLGDYGIRHPIISPLEEKKYKLAG